MAFETSGIIGSSGCSLLTDIGRRISRATFDLRQMSYIWRRCLPQSSTQLPVCSYTSTELLSLRTKTSLLSLSTVDRLKDSNNGYHHPRRHRSSRGVKGKKLHLHSFIVASFNAQSVKGNDMACKRECVRYQRL